MSVDWPLTNLAECASFQEGYVNPSQKNSAYFDGDVKWLRAVDLNNSYVKNTTRTLSKAGFDSAGKSALLFEPNTLAISKSGTIGRVGILRDYMCGNRAVINIKVNTQKCNNLFIFFVLLSNRKTIENLAIGSVQKNLYPTSLGKLEFRLPPKQTQDAIAAILASLHNKIELNHQTNQTLEQITQALFKSWFVDFEPTRAKIAAKQAGKDPERAAMAAISGKTVAELDQLDAAQLAQLKTTAALFPDGLVESELGEVPKGWETGRVEDLFELHRGFDLPKKDRSDGNYPVFAAGGYHGQHREFKIKPPGIITGRSGVIGNVYLSLESFWPLNTTLYVREFKGCGPYYSYFFLLNCDLKSLNSGSAVPSLNRNFVHSLECILPDGALLDEFEGQSVSLFEKIKANEIETSQLSKLRDALLPKLLSGELSPTTTEVA